ncbi:MAG: bifunctional diaminohydroxyphosphoribosylaminopyrimidine deaminase/5-amino-6-(5-phosphoribosylamino)uracil reductase RibD [Kiritimatiellae bacterium]|nr:bifunctional diaminohydroxyphosphoribosylaminopyrimidine deaminase/5-amino-6-(5-phosphoribosylamino)uracil reductase RibD [Kiritimatiellia bacterium]
MNSRLDHNYWMARALTLARRGEGLTRPNPPVGAVIVRGRGLVGQGWHHHSGGLHAEALAIQEAGGRARNATLYVTLEPCCTQGRTPPCTRAIIQSGIRRVVLAAHDPNPRHNGRGIAILRKAGIEVIEGVAAPKARQLIAPFMQWIRTRRPYLTLKLAVSLDGKIADERGRSRWITGPAARAQVQAWRRSADAILVGARTVLADDPSLLPKPPGGRRPWRVIVDTRGILAASAKIFTDGYQAQTIIATTRRCPVRRQTAWRSTGAQVWVLPGSRGGVSLTALMKKLGSLGCLHVLCEGGADLSASLIRAGLVNEFRFFIAPCIIGGGKAPGAVGGIGWPLSAAPELVFTECRRMGQDLLITAKPRPRQRNKQTSNTEHPTSNIQ